MPQMAARLDSFLCISTLAIFLVAGQASTKYCPISYVDTPLEVGMCPLYESLYPVYEKVEDALVSNPEILYMIRQVFLQTLHIQLPPVDVVDIEPCIKVDRFEDCSAKGNYSKCWQFQWSNSPLLNVITVDELLAFENVFSVVVYSRIAGSVIGRYLTIPLHIDSLPCTVSESEILQTLAMIISWVSQQLSQYVISVSSIWGRK